MLRRKRRIGWRFVAAALVGALAAIPISNFHWALFDLTPYDAETGSHPQFVSAPVSETFDAVTSLTWRVCPSALEAMLASAAGLAVFVAIGGRRACLSVETRCAQCGRVLRSLGEPACPSCGARL